MPKTQKAVDEAKEILADHKFIAQKGVRSLVDKDARVGYKSPTDSFYGYKIGFAMIPEERIITAVSANNGSYVDGSNFDELYSRSKASELTIKEVYGDKACFRKAIIETFKKDLVDPIILVNCCVYKIDEARFTYNKDSDQWFCEMGNHTMKKVSVKSTKSGRTVTTLINRNVLGAQTSRIVQENQPRKRFYTLEITVRNIMNIANTLRLASSS